MLKKNIIKIIVLLLTYHHSRSQELTIYKNQDDVTIVKSLFYEDKESSLIADDILKLDSEFKVVKNEVGNLGVAESSFWVKFKVKNITNKEILLEYAYPFMDKVHFYVVDENKAKLTVRIGDSYPFYSRKYNSPNYLFDLNLRKGEEKTFLLEIKSTEQVMLPLTITSKDSIVESSIRNNVIFGVYAGIFFIMIMYNIFVYISIKDRNYLFYVLHTIFVGLIQSTFLGYSFKFLWPNMTWFATKSTVLFTCLVSIVGIIFMLNFIKVRKYTPRFFHVYYFFIALYILIIIGDMAGLSSISYQIMQPTQTLIAFTILANAIIISRKGYRPAKFYLLAWSSLMVGIILFFLKDFGILPYNSITVNAMPTGAVIEVTLLSLALADRINILKKEKELARERELAALQENERIIIEQNENLEEKVRLRTEELNQILGELRQAQSQLVQVEKMASLGQLTAGIAHEINNPINFVKSNISPLKRDINDVLEIVQAYQETHGIDEEGIKDKLLKAKALEEELELDFLKEEMEQLLEGIIDGANRTAEIVNGLKTFSRLGESDYKKADIHEGIESTLMVLNEIIEGNVQVEKEYGDFGEINCLPGKLNQVFMNILENAVHATDQNKELGKERKLKIKTGIVGDKVEIRISDNGKGMPEKVRSQIFDPFFTTKDVGEGTGLGLSIVYSIIENHMGKITAESEVGKGTCFIISIPKKLESKPKLVKNPA